jgi:hypothetical protein
MNSMFWGVWEWMSTAVHAVLAGLVEGLVQGLSVGHDGLSHPRLLALHRVLVGLAGLELGQRTRLNKVAADLVVVGGTALAGLSGLLSLEHLGNGPVDIDDRRLEGLEVFSVGLGRPVQAFVAACSHQ